MFWSYVVVFALSAVPIIELKGAIPVGLSLGVPELHCFLLAIFGSILLSPLLILLTRRILAWLMNSSVKLFNRFGAWQHNRLAKKGTNIKKYGTWLFIFVLVAIPLPTTGVWTGSMVAGLFDIRMRIALPIIFVGNCVAGVLVWLIWGFATA
jgi:uncharacterized membrane protein